MPLSKEEYAKERINNGCSVWIKNSVTQDNCLASLGKPHDAEQLSVWRNFQLYAQQLLNILILQPLNMSRQRLENKKLLLSISLRSAEQSSPISGSGDVGLDYLAAGFFYKIETTRHCTELRVW